MLDRSGYESRAVTRDPYVPTAATDDLRCDSFLHSQFKFFQAHGLPSSCTELGVNVTDRILGMLWTRLNNLTVQRWRLPPTRSILDVG